MSRLYEVEMQKQQDALAKERKARSGSGDRSEKIRTYNFPQNQSHRSPNWIDNPSVDRSDGR